MSDIFDFSLDETGELNVNATNHDIELKTEDDLRIQMAFTRIKSISNNWYIDHIGADLEELIGRSCDNYNANKGKQKILQSLTYDDLWSSDDVYIKSEILNNRNIKYYVYLRTYQTESEDTITTEIIIELDLVKGVNIRYGF